MPKLEYSKLDSCATFPAIILAAGSATRMKGIDKNFMELESVPIVVRTIDAFSKSKNISEIVVVTREDKVEELSQILSCYKFEKIICVVKGGNCREESALCGIEALCDKFDKVVIHDGARPFVTDKIISDVCDALKINDSVSCGVKEKSTIKVINEDWVVTQSLIRDNLMSLQTPQGVSVKYFKESALINDLSKFTDDTSVVEAVGATTQVVEGSYRNIKITTPEDVQLAKLYLENMGE